MQNNLVELMSLLVFVMPDMYSRKKEQLKKMFQMFPKSQGEGNRSTYEQERILHAKRIMKPFFLRRLKTEVLKNLPKKTEEVIKVPLTSIQHENYFKMVAEYKKRAKDVSLQTFSCPFVRYFCMLFWDDITIIWDENIVYFFNCEKNLFWTNNKFVYLIFNSKLA